MISTVYVPVRHIPWFSLIFCHHAQEEEKKNPEQHQKEKRKCAILTYYILPSMQLFCVLKTPVNKNAEIIGGALDAGLI